MRYYWCVSCGYHGDFKFYRARNIKCEICEYDGLTEHDEQEYTEWAREHKSLQDKNPFYKSKGRLDPFGKKRSGNGKNKGSVD